MTKYYIEFVGYDRTNESKRPRRFELEWWCYNLKELRDRLFSRFSMIERLEIYTDDSRVDARAIHENY